MATLEISFGTYPMEAKTFCFWLRYKKSWTWLHCLTMHQNLPVCRRWNAGRVGNHFLCKCLPYIPRCCAPADQSDIEVIEVEREIKQENGTCPVCQEEFPMSELPVHATFCAERSFNMQTSTNTSVDPDDEVPGTSSRDPNRPISLPFSMDETGEHDEYGRGSVECHQSLYQQSRCNAAR